MSKSDTKVLITDYNPSKEYTFSVIAVSGAEQSRPLLGRYKGWFTVVLLTAEFLPGRDVFYYFIRKHVINQLCLLQVKEVRLMEETRLSSRG